MYRYEEQREFVLYTRRRSPGCCLVRRRLARRGYGVRVIETTNQKLRYMLAGLVRDVSRRKLPYAFLDGRPLGGPHTIRTLESSGRLERLVRGRI